MATLKRTAGTNLYEASYASNGSRFAYWPAVTLRTDEVSLGNAWAGDGVFVITASGDSTGAIEHFCEVSWNNSKRKGSKLITWRQGSESEPLWMAFDAKGNFLDGVDRVLVNFFIEDPANNEWTLAFQRIVGEKFSVIVDGDGSALQFVTTETIPAFQFQIGDKEIELTSEKVNGKKVFSKILVVDGAGSGSWQFHCKMTSTFDFLQNAAPMVRFLEGKFTVHSSPVFDLYASRPALDVVGLTFRLHPFEFGPSHTDVRFANAATPSLVSHFLDAAGRPVGLVSTPNSSLHFVAIPQTSEPKFHLAPSGLFNVSFAQTKSTPIEGVSTPVMEMLTGSSGTEFIMFAPQGSRLLPDSLLFISDSKGHLRYSASGEPEWTTKAKTSWIAPVQSASITSTFPFTSQPEEAPLFSIKAKSGNQNAFTGLLEPPGMAFDPAPISVGNGGGAIPMPMIPLGGAVPESVSSKQRFDRRGLVPSRRSIAAKNWYPTGSIWTEDAFAGETTLRWVVMPQGYLVALDNATRWWKISFAVAEGDIRAQLVLNRPVVNGRPVERWPVEESLSRSAIFLVATRFPDQMPETGGTGSESTVDALLSVDGWSVKLTIGGKPKVTAFDEPAILVVKLGGKRSFIDLKDKLFDWSLASVFNKDPAASQSALNNTVNSLEMLTKGESPYAPGKQKIIAAEAASAYELLFGKLNDPEWSGVVLFNGVSKVTDLPEGVAALKGGVNKNELEKGFWVPCLGLDLCKVFEEAQVTKPGAPEQVASFFAGVHFLNLNPLNPPNAKDPSSRNFEMRLKNLDVVLHNSSLKMFLAKADLRIGALFGVETKVEKPKSQSNGIVSLEGSYQGRSTVDKKEQYLIRALGEQTIEMGTDFLDTDFLDSVTLSRLELASSKSKDGSITFGRLGLWGKFKCGGGVRELTGVESVKFENLAISVKIEGDKTQYGLDAGHIDVDWDRNEKISVGWLDKFPLKLSGMRWGSANFSVPEVDWPKLPRLEMPQLGFTELGLGGVVKGLGTNLGTSCDFALEFDMDMGGLGGMTDAAKLLRSKVLLGWPDFRRFQIDPTLPRFAVGFKFEGGAGPLDIGIQGIIRIKAKKAILKRYPKSADRPELFGIGLDEPQLEVLGYKVPENPKNLFLAVVVELEDGERANKNPTWFVRVKEATFGPIDLDYFAVGQNVLFLESPLSINNVTEAVEKSKMFIDEHFVDENLGALRPQKSSGKWDLVADGKIASLAKIKLVFLDDLPLPLYGLRVEAPISQPLFDFDILYKKLSDDLGVFSLEVDLKGLRNIELGVGSLTLPVFGFRQFTNGDWDLNFGFNYNDFSAAGTLQALPFLGSASTRIGQLSGQSGNFLLAGSSTAMPEYYSKTLKLKPVYEIQTAFRLGIGKEIREGIFSAGASLSIYGIFQGALGTITDSRAQGRRYIKLAGAAGILLEVFGVVNFSLVSAGACIRAWVETGLVLETWQEIAIYAEAVVSIYVRFVAASFEVFGKRFEIVIHFSFRASLRIGATLPVVLDAPFVPGLKPPPNPHYRALLDTEDSLNCLSPIHWVAKKVIPGEEKLEVPVAVSADPQIGDNGQPVIVPMLALVDAHPQGRPALGEDAASKLVVIALRWAVRLSMNLEDDPKMVTAKDLRDLQVRLRGPSQKSMSRWTTKVKAGRTNPLNAATIRDFFNLNVQMKLKSPGEITDDLLAQMEPPATLLEAAVEPLVGIPMPWLRELGLRTVGGRILRDFTDSSYDDEGVDEEYEGKLRDSLAQGRPIFDSIDPCQSPALSTGLLAEPPNPKKKALLDVLLEDWSACLIEAGVHRALQLLEQYLENNKLKPTEPMPYAELEKLLRTSDPAETSPPAAQVTQQAGSILMHAMRAPARNTAWVSLVQRSGLEVGFAGDGFDAADTGFEVVAPTLSWLQMKSPVQILFDQGAGKNAGDVKTYLTNLATSAMRNHPKLIVEEFRDFSAKEDRTAWATHGIPLYQEDGVKPFKSLLALPAEVASIQIQHRSPGQVPNSSIQITFKGFDEFKPGKSLERKAAFFESDANAVQIGGMFKLSLRRVSAADSSHSLPGVYAISGGGEVARQVLASWKKDLIGLTPERFLILWKPSSDKVPGGASATRAIKSDVQFFVTNLSTEANPDSYAFILDQNTPSVVTDISDTKGFREFLWKTALVNSDGFFIDFGAKNENVVKGIEHEFNEGRGGEISVAWSRPAFVANTGNFHPYETHLFVDPRPNDSDLTVKLGLNKPQEISGVPDGFVKLAVRKPNPVATLHAASKHERELLARYAFLEYSIDPGPTPEKSRYVAMSADVCTPIPLQAPGNDEKQPLDQQNPEELEHDVLIPVLNFAKANRDASGKLKSGADGKVDPDALNPYALIGTNLNEVLKFGLRDGAGHRYPSNIDVDMHPLLLVWREPLRSLSDYPGVSLSWTASPLSGQVKFTIALAWSMEAKMLEDKSFVTTSRNLFRRLSWMLDIENGTKVEPFVRVGSTILATLPPEESKVVLNGFVEEILKILNKLMQKQANPPIDLDVKDKFKFDIKVPKADLPPKLEATEGPQRLEIAIAIERLPHYFDEDLARTDKSVRRIECDVIEQAGGAKDKSWAKFAEDFENAFALGKDKTVYFLKLSVEVGRQSCWLANAAVIRQCLKAQMKLVSFAPVPLSTEFLSGVAQVLDLTVKDENNRPPPTPKVVADIDLDLLASRYLDFVENVLQPEVASKMCKLSQLPTKSSKSFQNIMSSKASIVEAYTARLKPIEKEFEKNYENNPADTAVKDRFNAEALANLKHIYELGAICAIHYEVPVDTGAPAWHRVYGDIDVLKPKRPETFELSKLRLPLDGASEAAFSVFWKGKRHSDLVEGDGLGLTPRYVECKWGGKSDFGEYIPSRWFELIGASDLKKPQLLNLGKGKLIIPLPLRLIPPTPHVYSHSAKGQFTTPETLEQTRRWNYSLDSAVPAEEQDRATFEVRYEPQFAVLASSEGRRLFDALVTFDHYKATLGLALKTVAQWKIGDDPTKAVESCGTLDRFIDDVAKSLKSHGLRINATLAEGPSDRFEASISVNENRQRLDYECTALAGAVKKRGARLELTGLSLRQQPTPIKPEDTSQPIDDLRQGETGHYDYSGKEPYSAIDGISGLSGRQLTLTGLDIFQHATATPYVIATRNEKLGELKVSNRFVFRTGVATADRLVPRLHVSEVKASDIGKKKLNDHMAAIAKALFAEATHRLSVDGNAVLRFPYQVSPTAGSFTYPLSTMKGQEPEPMKDWVELFRRWGVRLEAAMIEKSEHSKPIGIELSLAVYADRYAGSRPVLVIDKIEIPWEKIAVSAPALGLRPAATHRVEDLAAVLFGLTDRLKSPDSKALQEARNVIGLLVRWQVPSMNPLNRRIPLAWELREPETAKAWKSCVNAAIEAFGGEKPASLPLVWSLEPLDQVNNFSGMKLSDSKPFLGSRMFTAEMEVGPVMTLVRSGHNYIFAGKVALVLLRPSGTQRRKQSPKSKGVK